MEKFTKLSGIAAPLPLINVDTDMIIPKQFLKTIKRSGLGVNLFHEMRYDDDGNDIPEFVLNKPQYREAYLVLYAKNTGVHEALRQVEEIGASGKNSCKHAAVEISESVSPDGTPHGRRGTIEPALRGGRMVDVAKMNARKRSSLHTAIRRASVARGRATF